MRQKAVKATCCKTPGGARLGGEGTSTRIWFGCTAYSALSNPLYDLGKTPRLSSTGEEEKRSSDERKKTKKKDRSAAVEVTDRRGGDVWSVSGLL